jgi:hypothetical protein
VHKSCLFKRGQGKGYVGIVNALFCSDNREMVHGDCAGEDDRGHARTGPESRRVTRRFNHESRRSPHGR